MEDKRNLGGRPTDYKQSIVDKCYEYIDSCQDEVVSVVSGESEKFTTYKEKVRVKLPTIEGLAVYLGISKNTIYEWEKIHPEFSDVINVLRGKQAERLINNGLSGDYNPVIAKLMLGKHDYRDSSDVKQSGQITLTQITGMEIK